MIYQIKELTEIVRMFSENQEMYNADRIEAILSIELALSLAAQIQFATEKKVLTIHERHLMFGLVANAIGIKN